MSNFFLETLFMIIKKILFTIMLDVKNLPEYEEIKNLERIAKKDGSSISYEQLIGIWKFNSVWKKGSDQIDNLSSAILQVLSAKLELKKKNSKTSNLNFEIKNSISFGVLSIVFYGHASLRGIRPLLPFYFENLSINIGKFTLVKKLLKKPEEKRMPFFSLIAMSKEKNWMCARGRGGGLAIWIKS